MSNSRTKDFDKSPKIRNSLRFLTLKTSHVKTGRQKLLFLNNSQLKTLNLIPENTLILQVGATELSVNIATQIVSASPNTLYLSQTVFDAIPYYQGEPLSLILLSDKKMILGPALGLTVSQNTWKNIEKSKALKKRALLALEKGMLFYCFRLSKVDWDNNAVEAYCLNPNNYQWVKQIVPVPHFIYDRGSYPGPKTVEGFSKKGNIHNIQWINTTRTLGKWETFLALNSLPETSEYIPETTLFSVAKLTKFLQKYKYCFIKSNYGRGGRQVYRVEKKDQYFLCKTGGNVIKSIKFKDVEELSSFLQNTLGENIILQQGIFLGKIDDSPFDMRILVQKNIDKEWIISAINFRIAKPGAIVTNFAAGARDVFTAPGQNLLHPDLSWGKLKEFSLKIITALENYFGSLGEIGLDVALDTNNKLWLIEANSRPSSIAYREADPESCKQIFGLPLDYVCSLARQNFIN